ncbi:MAG: hypothetical protein K8L91_15800 [Anaerolineae bacterium]|nr:hypothetical protein [Anaerolineae bacterium]
MTGGLFWPHCLMQQATKNGIGSRASARQRLARPSPSLDSSKGRAPTAKRWAKDTPPIAAWIYILRRICRGLLPKPALPTAANEIQALNPFAGASHGEDSTRSHLSSRVHEHSTMTGCACECSTDRCGRTSGLGVKAAERN